MGVEEAHAGQKGFTAFAALIGSFVGGIMTIIAQFLWGR